ncbi:MAG: hypothetical protein AAF735_07405 [Myxococcota bacterium]
MEVESRRPCETSSIPDRIAHIGAIDQLTDVCFGLPRRIAMIQHDRNDDGQSHGLRILRAPRLPEPHGVATHSTRHPRVDAALVFKNDEQQRLHAIHRLHLQHDVGFGLLQSIVNKFSARVLDRREIERRGERFRQNETKDIRGDFGPLQQAFGIPVVRFIDHAKQLIMEV